MVNVAVSALRYEGVSGYLLFRDDTAVFATGNPITLAAVKYQHESVEDQIKREVNVYTEVNGYRLPNYHRLDLSATLTRTWKKHESTWNFSLYNAYGRQNAYTITFQENEHDANRTSAIKTSLFRWVPSISYGFKF